MGDAVGVGRTSPFDFDAFWPRRIHYGLANCRSQLLGRTVVTFVLLHDIIHYMISISFGRAFLSAVVRRERILGITAQVRPQII